MWTSVSLILVVFGLFSAFAVPNSPTNQIHTAQPFGGPLSLADAVNLALRQSPNILRAQKDLEANKGIAVQTRAIALPTLGIAGSYSAAQLSDVDVISFPGIGFNLPSDLTFTASPNRPWCTSPYQVRRSGFPFRGRKSDGRNKECPRRPRVHP